MLAAPVDGARRPAPRRPEAVVVAVAVQDPALVGSERRRPWRLKACEHAYVVNSNSDLSERDDPDPVASL